MHIADDAECRLNSSLYMLHTSGDADTVVECAAIQEVN